MLVKSSVWRYFVNGTTTMNFPFWIVTFAASVTVFFSGCGLARPVSPQPDAAATYFRDLKSAIQEKFDVTNNWPAHDARVQFTISREGRLGDIRVVSPLYITSEQRNKITSALESVSPFRLLPEVFNREYLTVILDVKMD